jgi:hypothetical protein
MAIDDRLEKALGIYSKELDPDLFKKIVSNAINQIPHYGNEINKLLFGDAQRRVAERAKDVFDAVKERVERIEESKIDKEFLKSDEFMTIVILAIEQLQTTHDTEKKRMIANALANSGVVGFSSDSRKELFMRILRDLAPEHVAMLKSMLPRTLPNRVRGIAREIKDPPANSLAVLQRLAAQGLIDEFQEKKRPSIPISNYSSKSDATKVLEELIMALPTRGFRINRFGEDFLRYFGAEETAASSEPPHHPSESCSSGLS